jgi:hypothetical protein
MKKRFVMAAAATLLIMPIVAQAQGVFRGTEEGAHEGGHEGDRALGPVGGAVGTVVGGVAGGVVGGVNGVLGIHPHHWRRYRHYHD